MSKPYVLDLTPKLHQWEEVNKEAFENFSGFCKNVSRSV